MTDKERILMIIITRIISGLTYGCISYKDKEKYIKSFMLERNGLEKGDLVFANTSIYPNDFSVGFVEELKDDCTVIREIGSNKLCNYYNESFTRINKEHLGYEILEGVQYEIYRKVLKAFEYTGYCTRFKSISFKDKECTVLARKSFSNETYFEVSFPFNSKTSIKSIGKLLESKENESKQ